MFDIDRIVKALQTDPKAQMTAAGIAGGAVLLGGLGGALRLGAVAVLGGLAYDAWRKHKQGEDTEREAFIPPDADEKAREELGKSLVRAMIAAAKADGEIDAAEKQAIFSRLEAMNLSPEEKAWVFDELSGPLDVDAVVSRADTPEHAAEIYAASLVAISGKSPTERAYLDTLAKRLGLEPGLAAEIESTARAAAPA